MAALVKNIVLKEVLRFIVNRMIYDLFSFFLVTVYEDQEEGHLHVGEEDPHVEHQRSLRPNLSRARAAKQRSFKVKQIFLREGRGKIGSQLTMHCVALRHYL